MHRATDKTATQIQASTECQDDAQVDGLLSYRLCPQCQRAVLITSNEQYCVNDGARLLEACPACHAAINSPYARYCAGCSTKLLSPDLQAPQTELRGGAMRHRKSSRDHSP